MSLPCRWPRGRRRRVPGGQVQQRRRPLRGSIPSMESTAQHWRWTSCNRRICFNLPGGSALQGRPSKHRGLMRRGRRERSGYREARDRHEVRGPSPGLMPARPWLCLAEARDQPATCWPTRFCQKMEDPSSCAHAAEQRAQRVIGRRDTAAVYPPPPPHGSCGGSLIRHLDGTPASCTVVEDDEECPGLELRHEGDPTTCVAEWG